MTTLYHYTCHHGHTALRQCGTVLPAAWHHPTIVAQLPPDVAALTHLSWFTDMTPPEPGPLGLTRRLIVCERTTYRWRVLTQDGLPPIRWGQVRNRFPQRVTDQLETENGAEPARWWVAGWPVYVTYDPT